MKKKKKKMASELFPNLQLFCISRLIGPEEATDIATLGTLILLGRQVSLGIINLYYCQNLIGGSRSRYSTENLQRSLAFGSKAVLLNFRQCYLDTTVD